MITYIWNNVFVYYALIINKMLEFTCNVLLLKLALFKNKPKATEILYIVLGVLCTSLTADNNMNFGYR